MIAPTGSGKTLAAFLWAIDKLATEPVPADPQQRCRVLYISPLKALAVDIERNLRSPLTGVGHAARRLGLAEPDIRVGVRTGDTAADERRKLAGQPPDILITTPESLFLLLTSQARDDAAQRRDRDRRRGARAGRRQARRAPGPLAGAPGRARASETREEAAERGPAQRIGLSATVRPPEEVAAFLGGAGRSRSCSRRSDKRIDLQIVVPVEDMADLETAAGRPGRRARARTTRRAGARSGRTSRSGCSTRSRPTAPRSSSRTRAAWPSGSAPGSTSSPPSGPEERGRAAAGRARPAPPPRSWPSPGRRPGAPAEVARAHHGSVSRQERTQIEEALKAGRLPAVVATSSLELGIDMGAVDLVIQVESPPSVASGLQRTGRAGHHVGDISRGVIFPKYQGDLVQATVVARRMRDGAIEELRMPRNPLDVLAQQIVAMTAMDDWEVGRAGADGPAGRAVRQPDPPGARGGAGHAGRPLPQRGVRRAAAPAGLGPHHRECCTAGRAASGWPSPTAGRSPTAACSACSWPAASGIVPAGTPGGSASSTRRWSTSRGSATCSCSARAPGGSRTSPPTRCWSRPRPGSRAGCRSGTATRRAARPSSAGPSAQYCRELGAASEQAATDRLRRDGLDELAAANLISYLTAQREATGYLPDDKTLVMERFRDELGDWRLVLHSPYGARVHAPWALAIAARLRERYQGMDVQALHTDDGIVIRVPDADDPPPAGIAALDPEEVEQLVTAELGLVRAVRVQVPGVRGPGAAAAQAAAGAADPAVAAAAALGAAAVGGEPVRHVPDRARDGPRVPAGRVRRARPDRPHARPRRAPGPAGRGGDTRARPRSARSLLFRYVGAFMYEGDAPLAERRAQALALDSSLLAELLGQADARELLDPDIVE